MRRTVLLGSLVTLFISAVQAVVAPSALAQPQCPRFLNDDFVASHWANDAVRGVEASVLLRKTGTVCDPDGEDSDWVAIEETGPPYYIIQAGFLHRYNSATDTVQYCRVWANHLGSPHAYKCGVDSGGTGVYFRVTVYTTPPPDANNYYDIEDCGSDGYATCTGLNALEPMFTDQEGAVAAAESNYGPNCFDQIMGSAALPVNVGTDVNPIKFQSSIGGSWATKTLARFPTSCDDYKGAFSNTIVSAWDDRN